MDKRNGCGWCSCRKNYCRPIRRNNGRSVHRVGFFILLKKMVKLIRRKIGEMNMIKFFSDLIDMTPVQHLIEYWFVWLIFLCICFGGLYYLNRKA